MQSPSPSPSPSHSHPNVGVSLPADPDSISEQKNSCTEASSEQCENLRDYAFAPFVCDAGVGVDFERVAETGEVIAFTPADLGVQDADTDNVD
jgi:hypothetical protein